MPAPYLDAWHPDVIAAASQVVLDAASIGSGDPSFQVYDENDVLLVTIVLPVPIGTLLPGGAIDCEVSQEASTIITGGTVSYGTLMDGNGVPLRSILCRQGTYAIMGYCVVDTLEVTATRPFNLISLIIG